MRDAAWEREVDALGASHAVRLIQYVIAVEISNDAFRHVDLIREGWSSNTPGHSLHDGRIDWASYVPKLKGMGREAVEAAVEAQRRHELRVSALNYAQLATIAKYDPVLVQLATVRRWSWRVDHPDGYYGESLVRMPASNP